MIYKITGFTKFSDGQDADCEAITEDGKKIIVDPFVGCAFEYENREALLNTWFETKDEHWLENEIVGKVLLPRENDFKLVQKQ